MLLVFGISFEIPLFVIMLNLAGIVSGKALGRYRPWIILGTFIFAAVATPSTDPFSMLHAGRPDAGAVPAGRGRSPAGSTGPRAAGAHGTDQWADDEASPL